MMSPFLSLLSVRLHDILGSLSLPFSIAFALDRTLFIIHCIYIYLCIDAYIYTFRGSI